MTVTGTDLRQVTTLVGLEQFKAAQALAAQRGVSFAKILRSALDEFLVREARKAAKAESMVAR